MKQLLIFGGPPCTGKSTVARALGYAHLEMDAARARLLPESSHTRADRAVAYRAILWATGHLLQYTDVVICDGGFGHAEDRLACEETALAAGAKLYVAEFTAPVEVLIERNRTRRSHHPGLDLTDERVREIVSTYKLWGAGIVIDGMLPIGSCVTQVREYLATGE